MTVTIPSKSLQEALATLQQTIEAYLQAAIAAKCYPIEFTKGQQALQVLTILLDVKSIDDEALYNNWKSYQQETTKWFSTTLPAYKAATAQNLLERVVQTKAHLIQIITTARTYLTNYEQHKADIIGAVMQKKFKSFQEQAKEELEAPKTGWLYIQQIIEDQYQQLKEEQQVLAILKGYIQEYKGLVQQWDTRVQPNSKALLTDEKDVDTGKAILAVLQKIKTLLATAPESVQQTAQSWIALLESKKWEKRYLKLQVYYERSQQRQKTVLGAGENPALANGAVRKNYSYNPSRKKEQLYRKGKGDAYEIMANDVQQGDLDNCYVLSPIAALAQSNPKAIEELIEPQIDGSYKVTLYLRTNPDILKREKIVVKVRNEWARTKTGKAAYAGMGDQELWVQVLEKAYAQVLGDYDFMAEGGDASEVLEVLTNKKAKRVSLQGQQIEEVLTALEQAVENKVPVIVHSKVLEGGKKKEDIDNQQFIVNNHAYYLKAANSKTISLQNPQGSNHLEISWDILFKYFTYYSSL